MQTLMDTLARAAERLVAALRAALETIAAAVQRINHRKRSMVAPEYAVVPVDPVWPGKCYADGTPVDVRVTTRPYRREPHIRVRYGDIPDQYGNYPY